MKFKKIKCNKKEMNSNNNIKNNKDVECRYCHVIGHIKSKCPKLLARSQNHHSGSQESPKQVFYQNAKYNKPSLLINLNNVVKQDEFPVLGAPRNLNQTTTLNFASVFKQKDENQSPTNVLQENEAIINGHVMEILK